MRKTKKTDQKMHTYVFEFVEDADKDCENGHLHEDYYDEANREFGIPLKGYKEVFKSNSDKPPFRKFYRHHANVLPSACCDGDVLYFHSLKITDENGYDWTRKYAWYLDRNNYFRRENFDSYDHPFYNDEEAKFPGKWDCADDEEGYGLFKGNEVEYNGEKWEVKEVLGRRRVLVANKDNTLEVASLKCKKVFPPESKK